jgi:hypothetical protein
MSHHALLSLGPLPDSLAPSTDEVFIVNTLRGVLQRGT